MLAIRAPSRTFNPTLDPDEIAADTALDPAKALAEWQSEWRVDISAFVDRAVVEQLVDVGVRERGFDPVHRYLAFADEAGGSGQDSSTLSIVHIEGGVIVQDIARRWIPPFSPTQVIAEKAALLKLFHLNRVTGDKWSGGLAPDIYKKHGIRFEQDARPKADLYLDLLHLLNSGRVRLLDEPVQIAELCGLERRVAFGGRESIDHGLGGHDDSANALAGAATLAATLKRGPVITNEMMEQSRRPSSVAPTRRSMLGGAPMARWQPLAGRR